MSRHHHNAKRERRRQDRFLREIAAAEAKAMTPEAAQRRAQRAQQQVESEGARAVAREVRWRALQERSDEREFLEEALRSIAGTIADIIACDSESENILAAIDLIEDDSDQDVLSATVLAVYRDGAEGALPFLERAIEQKLGSRRKTSEDA